MKRIDGVSARETGPTEVELLAAKLGRPPTGLAALERLTPEQIDLLSNLIDGAFASQRQSLDESLQRAVPVLPHRLLLRFLGGRVE